MSSKLEATVVAVQARPKSFAYDMLSSAAYSVKTLQAVSHERNDT
jgi:hypothetical protein